MDVQDLLQQSAKKMISYTQEGAVLPSFPQRLITSSSAVEAVEWMQPWVVCYEACCESRASQPEVLRASNEERSAPWDNNERRAVLKINNPLELSIVSLYREITACHNLSVSLSVFASPFCLHRGVKSQKKKNSARQLKRVPCIISQPGIHLIGDVL